MAYEIEHISDHFQRVWLRKAIESWRYRTSFDSEERLQLFTRLCEVEGFERYLRRVFIGQKQFSLEGLDVLIPMLDTSLELARSSGAREVVIGMAHRGRLNVLAHSIGMPYEQILREFEGERTIDVVAADAEGGTGDVKYHLGAQGVRTTSAGKVGVTLAANPSHLEAVDPVVEGMTRAQQTDRSTADGAHDPTVAMPILLHGDAAFAGQGIVAETLNLYALEGYSTGGTLHLITNNQVGFTTDPAQGRSTRHSSDLAKGYDTPIVHVNADDPEAAISAVQLALAYRERFGHDVVIDLVGYRRFGHNEQDEPAYTQPLMVTQIAHHPTVRELYGARLVADGVMTASEADGLVEAVELRLRDAHERLRASFGHDIPAKSQEEPVPREEESAVRTEVSAKRLRRLTKQLLRVPENFTVNPKLERQLERRRTALEEGGIDWGQAEALALGSLLVEGVPVRLTGQDTERGTFSQRHLVLHDVQTGEIDIPMQKLDRARASFEVYNSPLSEYACVGFEYGYSTAAPDALILWEAQFGDFANGAQTIIDQFISSGLAKWQQTSRITLLLPHGYEGNGPEHSSARLERFLQLGAQDNIRIAIPTTAAQYFHLLRRQALDPSPRPLVVMTPKGLLRLKEATSTQQDLTDGAFRPVLDAGVDDKRAITRLALSRQGLLRHRRARGRRRGARGRRGEDRAALPLPGRRRPRVDRVVPLAQRDRLGAGGAPEHGRVAHDPSSSRGGVRGCECSLRRTALAGKHGGGLSDRAHGRPGPDRPRGPHRLARAARQARFLPSSLRQNALRAKRRPCFRASVASRRRCLGGSRRQISRIRNAVPIGRENSLCATRACSTSG